MANKRKLPKASDWQARDLADWNTITFHAYLADENKRRFGVEYSPFGRGSKGQRYGREQGQLKQALTTYGADVVKRFIDESFAEYASTPEFPCMTWGFVYAYRDRGLQRAQVAVKSEKARSERRANSEGQADVDVEELRKLL
jgi:hypothetical protein